jgi:flagellar protein FlaJ
VVDIALDDVGTRQQIVKERNSAMFVYKLIIIMSFFVFLVTVYFIVDAYMRLPTGLEVGEVKMGGVAPIEIKLLFYRMLLFQSIFAGVIAGQIGGGDVRSGIKYAIFLSAAVCLIFELIVMPMVAAPAPPET